MRAYGLGDRTVLEPIGFAADGMASDAAKRLRGYRCRNPGDQYWGGGGGGGGATALLTTAAVAPTTAAAATGW